MGAVISPRWAVVGLLALLVSTADARTLAIGDVHAEADVADEAGAVTLLVRSALARNTTVVTWPDDVTLAAASQLLVKRTLDHGVLMELSRDGTGLRLTLAIVDADGTRQVSFVRAGDGDVRGLARGAVDRIAEVIKIDKPDIAEPALGALRPYGAALRLRGNPDEAALALSDALPITAFAVSEGMTSLADLAGKVTNPALAVIAARALRDLKRLDAIAAGTDAVATAARALAAIQGRTFKEADTALGAKPPRHGLIGLVQVILAESRSDDRALANRLKEALTGDQPRAVLAVASTIAPARNDKVTHKLLVAYAEKHTAPGVGSRIGLAAAEQGVEVPRALALVSARELDDFDLKRLDALVAKSTDATAARLRAEMSMRRADGTEPATIPEFLRVAPDDKRAHRYHGWLLAGEGKYLEAAEAFTKAETPRERARALLAANEVKAALAAVGGTPTSPEELVIAMRVALADKNVDSAATTIAIAEKVAPVNPIVHQAILMLDAVKPDPARAQVSRLVVEKGSVQGQAQLAQVPTPVASAVNVTQDAGVGSDGSAGSAVPQSSIKTSGETIDPVALEPLLDALPGLQELPTRNLALAEIEYEQSLLSFRKTDPEKLRRTLIKVLSAPPYRLNVIVVGQKLPDVAVKPTALAKLTTDAEGVLVFRLIPNDREGAHISLLFYQRNATEAAQVAQVIKAPDLIVFDSQKLTAVLVFAGFAVLLLVLYILRGKGKVKIDIARPSDISDEVLCIEISKSPSRPRADDPVEFARTTRKAGVVTKQRSATLVTSGQLFKVPMGKWYVHLYGSFLRSGQQRAVPASCSAEVLIKRGQVSDARFDLTSKFADVRVEIAAQQPRGIVVWANDALHDKVTTDQHGVALLSLPVGMHTIHIDAHGHKFERQLQIVTARSERLSLNVERELRLEAGIAIDLPPEPTGAEIQMPEVKIRPTGSIAKLTPAGGERRITPAGTKPVASATVASAATAYDSSSSSKAASAPSQRLPRASTPKPGDRLLDRYRIIAELGRGAMGVVHRAWDEKLEREVAIKEMADDLRSNPEAMRLFTQEAKALAQLNHTNIVSMYDQITDATGIYMIMEFVDGEPLESIVAARGALPWRDAAGIIDQVCAGLAYAHARKVIHRDIKPANIFVASDRTVKIGDFGLARVMREVTIRRTEIRGTPLYMAPEQITGTDVDHRTDLYAVGCTLFELVCGRPPFLDGDILYAQMNTPPPSPSGLVANLPAALDDLLLSLLAKHSDDRPGSANEVRAALKSLGV